MIHRSTSCQSIPSQYQISQTNQLLTGAEAGGHVMPGGVSGAGGVSGGDGG